MKGAVKSKTLKPVHSSLFLNVHCHLGGYFLKSEVLSFLTFKRE